MCRNCNEGRRNSYPSRLSDLLQFNILISRVLHRRLLPHNILHAALMDIFEAECEQRGVLYRPDDVFGYLRRFEPKPRQLSLFGFDGAE